MSIEEKNYVICGCTSGIGYETTISLARQGARLFLVGRDKSKLESLSEKLNNDKHECYELDLNLAHDDDFECMAAKDSKSMGRIDRLVYSAGIVGVSSRATKVPAMCQSVYAASKAAMNTAAKSLAYKLRDKGISVNTVMPWVVDTKMIRESKENGSMNDEKLLKIRNVWGVLSPKISQM